MLEKIADIKVFNDTFVDMLEGGQSKEAAVSALQYTRNKLRENSFAEKILTPIDIANDELDKNEDPEYHVKWCDREPDQPPAFCCAARRPSTFTSFLTFSKFASKVLM